MWCSVVIALALQQPSVEELIERLRVDDPDARDKAASEILARGEAAIPALEAASHDADPEVAGRCTDLARRIRLDARTRLVRKRLPAAIFEKIPDLAERLTSDAEDDFVSVVRDLRGVTGDGSYVKATYDLGTRRTAAVFEIVVERWRDAGKDWEKLPRALVKALYWTGTGPGGASGGGDNVLAVVDIPTLVDHASEDWWIDEWLAQDLAAPEDADAIVERLKGGGPHRSILISALGAAGAWKHRALIREALDDEKERVRVTACRAAARLGDVEAVPKLIELSRDGDREIANAAVEALVDFEIPAAAAALIDAARGFESYPRRQAIDALGEIGDPRAREVILEALDDSEAYIRSAASAAAVKMRLDGLADRLRAKMKGDAEPHRVLGWLVDVEGARALPDVRAALESENDVLRGRAVELAAQLGELEPIAKALESSNDGVRLKAARALGARGVEAAFAWLEKGEIGDDVLRFAAEADFARARPAVEKLLEGDGRPEAFAAVCAFDVAGDLVAKALRHSGAPMRLKTLEALKGRRTPICADLIEALMGDPDPEIRAAAIAALPKERSAKLKPLLDSPIRMEREDAALALGRHGDRDAAARLREMLRSPTPALRKDAAELLAELGDDASVPSLLSRADVSPSLSAIRAPGAYARLKALHPAGASLATIDDARAWTEKTLGLKLELGDGVAFRPVKLEEPDNGIDAVGRLHSRAVPILEEDGRVRLLRPLDARAFWRRWWYDRHP